MKVQKRIISEETVDIFKIHNVRLLTDEEACKLLSKSERAYRGYWWVFNINGKPRNVSTGVHADGTWSGTEMGAEFKFGFVRPALIIEPVAWLDIGDIFTVNGYTFKLISKEIAWMYNGDIGMHAFNERDISPAVLHYEDADIKQVVDAWYKSLTEGEDNNNA